MNADKTTRQVGQVPDLPAGFQPAPFVLASPIKGIGTGHYILTPLGMRGIFYHVERFIVIGPST